MTTSLRESDMPANHVEHGAAAEAPPRQIASFSREPLPNPPPAFVLRLASAFRNWLLRFADRLAPPEVLCLEATDPIVRATALGAMVRFRIPDLLEESGPVEAEKLAALAGVNADALHRTLRALAAATAFFSLDAQGRFSNSPASRLLCRDRLSNGWIRLYTSPAIADVYFDYDGTVETGENAYRRVKKMSSWDWFAQHPDDGEAFALGMAHLTVMQAPFVATLYDFRKAKIICDIGGGNGMLLSELLIRNTHLRGVLLESRDMVPHAERLLADRGVSERATFVPGSFFQEIPQTRADTYILKNVLHDWDDETCLKILSNIRRAMTAGERLLVIELVLERNALDPVASIADINMMSFTEDGRERSHAELTELFVKSGFRITGEFPAPMFRIFALE